MAKSKNLTGLWKSKKHEGQYSFRMTDKVKEALSEVPIDSFVTLGKNTMKNSDTQPDLNLWYFPLEVEQVETDDEIPF